VSAALPNGVVKNANLVSRWAPLVALGLTLLVAACDQQRPPDVPPPAAKTVTDFFPIKVGDRVVRMQLAVRPDEQQNGLMHRRDLGADDGMLFVYARPQRMGFWMHNTPTPLDIGFFNAAGQLQEIYPMHPFDENTVSSSSSELQYALEMNQGWFRANGVKPGAQLDMKALAAAMKARGFELRLFGLKE
jgi:uncharacterized protein